VISRNPHFTDLQKHIDWATSLFDLTSKLRRLSQLNLTSV